MGGGSGGSTGMVAYPDYMQEMHHIWLTQVDQDMVNLRAWNPYLLAAAFNPNTFLGSSSEAVAAVYDAAGIFNPETSWQSSLAVAKEVSDANVAYLGVKQSIVDVAALANAMEYASDWNTAVDTAHIRIEDSDYNEVLDALLSYKTILDALIAGDFWTAAATTVSAKIDSTFSTSNANADALAYAQILEDEITARILPRFKSGMRDINAAMGSAFVLGEAIIWGMMDRDVAKYLAGLKEKLIGQKAMLFDKGIDQIVKLEADKLINLGSITTQRIAFFAKKGDLTYSNAVEMLKMIGQKIEFLQKNSTTSAMVYNSYSDDLSKSTTDILHSQIQKIAFLKDILHYVVESNRIAIVANKEYASESLAIADNAKTWYVKSYQFGNNVLASIGSGVAMNEPNVASKTTTAIGGAMSGAATGAMVGSSYPAVGTAIGAAAGAIIGGIGGYLGGGK